MGEKRNVAGVGDVVMPPGNVRGIVIGIKGEFVTVLGILTNKEGDTIVIPRPNDFLARECRYMKKQTLNP